jgi:HD-like signal output (HDOD) protein
VGREAYFVAGLLHDLGKLPLNRQFPQEYSQIWNAATRDVMSLHQAEDRFMGLDHCAVGGMIAEKWRLGAALVESLLFHHNPDACSEDNRQFVSIVSLANQIAIHLEIGTAGDRFIDQALISYLIKAVGVNWPTLHDLREKVLGEIQKAQIFLEIARRG